MNYSTRTKHSNMAEIKPSQPSALLFASLWFNNDDTGSTAGNDSSINHVLPFDKSDSELPLKTEKPDASTSADATAPTCSKNNKQKQKKDDDGRPRRPRSAYNFFFQMQRKVIMEKQKHEPKVVHKSMRNKHRIGKHANVGFVNLARIVGESWRKVDPELRKELEDQAQLDKKRYEREMVVWRGTKKCIDADDADGVDKQDATYIDAKANNFNFVTPDTVNPKFVVSDSKVTKDLFPRLPFKATDFAEDEDLQKAVSFSPVTDVDETFICSPCNDTSRNSTVASSTPSADGRCGSSSMPMQMQVQPMMNVSMFKFNNANNYNGGSQTYIPQRLPTTDTGSFGQHQSIVSTAFPSSSSWGYDTYSAEGVTCLSLADRMRIMEMERREFQHQQFQYCRRVSETESLQPLGNEDANAMDALRAYNNRFRCGFL